MYGAQTWRVAEKISDKIPAFTNPCLSNILGERWSNTISNEDLSGKTYEEKMKIQRRK